MRQYDFWGCFMFFSSVCFWRLDPLKDTKQTRMMMSWSLMIYVVWLEHWQDIFISYLCNAFIAKIGICQYCQQYKRVYMEASHFFFQIWRSRTFHEGLRGPFLTIFDQISTEKPIYGAQSAQKKSKLCFSGFFRGLVYVLVRFCYGIRGNFEPKTPHVQKSDD